MLQAATALTALLLLSSSSLAASSSVQNILFVPSGASDSTRFGALSSCSPTYHATYEGTAVYKAANNDDCISQSSGDSEWTAVRSDDAGVIMHVQQAALAETRAVSISWLERVERHIDSLFEPESLRTSQRIFNSASPRLSYKTRPTILYTPSSRDIFYSIPTSLVGIADQLFPTDAILVGVPSYPLPLAVPSSSRNSSAPDWLNQALSKLHYSNLVDALIADVDPEQIQRDVRHLTNEDGKATWLTRHSFTTGARQAAAWIKHTMETEGGASCIYHDHDYGFSPNVVCTYKGTEFPDEYVVMGAHYDSRGTFGHVRAPGGDDDASGTSALLSIARLIKDYHIEFKRTVHFVWFSGEEQGLWGSRALAKQMKDENKNVRMMLQADMLGYRKEGETMQLALPDKYDTIEARWLVGNLSTLYAPELAVGTTPACCSDHQSFDQSGYVSTWVFERNGAIADPKYHNSEDISDREGYNFEQIAAIARVMFATVLEVAGFDLYSVLHVPEATPRYLHQI